jgi:hypothetical protein|tara:strand:+ start:1613 stop:1960 length:348 start_codon:yes stop_codon:yes gene_type:complete
MPTVNGKKYPYTKAGMAAAKKAGAKYDYRSAVTAQIFGTDVYDKESKHWGSRIPDNPTMKALGMDGRTLKSVNHPTFDLTAEGERKAGYNFASGKDRRLKSVPGKKVVKKKKKGK